MASSTAARRAAQNGRTSQQAAPTARNGKPVKGDGGVRIRKLLKGLKRGLAGLQDVDGRIKSIEDGLAEIRALVRKAPSGITSMPSLPGVEPKKFSFARAFEAIASRDWSRAGYEKEVFKETRKRALAPGSGGGSYIVPEEIMEEIIPMLRSKMVWDKLGVREMNVTGQGYTITVPRQTVASTGYWIGDNSAITASDPEWDNITMTPHKAVGMVKFSRRYLRTGSIGNVEQQVRRDLVNVLARLIQLGFLNGSGASNQPTGVLNMAGTNAVAIASNVDATILQKLQQMQEEIEVDEIAMESPAWVMHPRAKHRIGRITYSGGGPILTGQHGGDWRTAPAKDGYNLLGYPMWTTTQMPINTVPTPDESDIIFADWEEVLVALWSVLELAASDQAGTAFENDQIWIRAIQEVDINVMHAVGICVGTAMSLNVG